jgi:excisionase family DNA binding protein
MSVDEIRKMLDDHAVVPLWPETGHALGLKRNHVYRAAAEGSIRTIRMGRLLKVPTSWLRQKLGLGGEAPGA